MLSAFELWLFGIHGIHGIYDIHGFHIPRSWDLSESGLSSSNECTVLFLLFDSKWYIST